MQACQSGPPGSIWTKKKMADTRSPLVTIRFPRLLLDSFVLSFSFPKLKNSSVSSIGQPSRLLQPAPGGTQSRDIAGHRGTLAFLGGKYLAPSYSASILCLFQAASLANNLNALEPQVDLETEPGCANTSDQFNKEETAKFSTSISLSLPLSLTTIPACMHA